MSTLDIVRAALGRAEDTPDTSGHYGPYGGRYVPETLMAALDELSAAYDAARVDPKFQAELAEYLSEYVGRPTALTFAPRLSARVADQADVNAEQIRIYLKREDLCHTGAHKINNTIGQLILAKALGKTRIIAETGAGQHGVATATAAAFFGLECCIYMGAEDVKRQSLNVFRMKMLGAEVIPVSAGSKTLKDAMNEAIRDWVTNVRTTHYVIGSVAGPHPYPMMVRDFQRVIGVEAKKQFLKKEDGALPDYIVACVGGGSNAMGIFHPFLSEVAEGKVKLVGVEAAGYGLESGKHGAPLALGEPGVLHGSLSYVLQDQFGQIAEAHSISAGLDYPGVGPEHSFFKDEHIAVYGSVTDDEALVGFRDMAETEGILAALESSHAIAYLRKLVADKKEDLKSGEPMRILLCLSGRGDKDVQAIADHLGIELGDGLAPGVKGSGS